jgi:hypothetical protein
MNKVFFIGFHKTGTTSFGEAMNLLGYTNCHGAGKIREEIGDQKMMQLLFQKEYSFFIEKAKSFDSFNDNPWFFLYKEFDHAFPGSKFILVLREESSWLNSCKNYFKSPFSPFRFFLYGKGNPINNEERYLSIYRNHNLEVQNYFADRSDDLLILKLEDDKKWDKLCTFLGKENTVINFPFLNQSKK